MKERQPKPEVPETAPEEGICVWIPLPVVAKQRARLTRRRRGRPNMAYTPEATRNFEQQVGDLLRAATDEYSFGRKPVCVSIDIHKDGFWLTIQYAEQSVRPVGVRGDVDNYVKSIFDGLNSIAWYDDKQVELLTVGFVGAPRKAR